MEKCSNCVFADKCVVHGLSEKILSCSDYCKKLTDEELKRVSDLNTVWDYLYRHEEWVLCGIVSKEIGAIKGTIDYE